MGEPLNAGQTSSLLDAAIREAVGVIVDEILPLSVIAPAQQRQQLIDGCYQAWYTRSAEEKNISPLPQPDYPQVYRVMHRGDGEWEPGWLVQKVSSAGRLMVSRDEEIRIVAPGDYLTPEKPGLLPRPGMSVSVVARREIADEQPGFWITASPAWYQLEPGLLRLYWNTDPEGGALLVEQVTRNISDTVPYSLKLPVDAIGFQRADAAVLYIQASYFAQIRPTLVGIHRHMQPRLWPQVPGMCRVLAPGLGLAEDPPHANESFGLHRCRLIADAIIAAGPKRWHDPSRLAELVKLSLQEAGIDPDRPYLNPPARKDYDWEA